MIRPIYTLRDVEPQYLTSGPDSLKWWPIIDSSRLGTGLRFTMGLVSLPRGASCSIRPDVRSNDQRETVCMLLKGRAHITSSGVEDVLDQYDCVYRPSASPCSLKNAGVDPVYYLWAAPLLRTPPPPDARDGAGVTVVHATQDQKGGETSSTDGHSWRPINSSLTGSSALDMSVVTRPAGWSGPLHSHRPPDAQEAFVTLEGELTAVDEGGARYTLEAYDCVYIPPYARHQNRNASDGEVTFVVIGSPADVTHAP